MDYKQLLTLRKKFFLGFSISLFFFAVLGSFLSTKSLSEVYQQPIYTPSPEPTATLAPPPMPSPTSKRKAKHSPTPTHSPSETPEPFSTSESPPRPTHSTQPDIAPHSSESTGATTLYIMTGVSLCTSICTLIGVLSTTLLAWKKAKVEAKTMELDNRLKEQQLKKLERDNQELPKSGTPKNKKRK